MSARASDWRCPVCQFNIFGHKTECGKCHTTRPGRTPPTATVPPKPAPVPRAGDWPCTYCGLSNFANRTACFKCKRAREGTVTAATSACVVCMDGPLEMVIHPCGHVCVCRACAEPLDKCPLCRVTITKKERVYVQ